MPLARAVFAPVPSSPRATKPPGAPFRAFPRRPPGLIRVLRGDRTPIAMVESQDLAPSPHNETPGTAPDRVRFLGGIKRSARCANTATTTAPRTPRTYDRPSSRRIAGPTLRSRQSRSALTGTNSARRSDRKRAGFQTRLRMKPRTMPPSAQPQTCASVGSLSATSAAAGAAVRSTATAATIPSRMEGIAAVDLVADMSPESIPDEHINHVVRVLHRPVAAPNVAVANVKTPL